MKISFLVLFLPLFGISIAQASSEGKPNPSLVGWSNLIFPGAGQMIRGNMGEGLGQTAYEGGSFALGYSLSDAKGFSSLDGINDTFRPFRLSRSSRNAQESLDRKMLSNISLEFAIKAHMTNTFLAYRDAYRDIGVTEGIDQRTAWEGLTVPFEKKYFSDPEVYIPLIIVFGAVVADYFMTSPEPIQALTPSSNLLYDFNYGFWQPFGSGYPEEAFFRGFLQHEVTKGTGSPLVGVLAQTLAFAFSHEPGNGRFSAAAVGAYLGYLSYKNKGDLGPGVTVHFWGDLLLGLETSLLSHKGQRTTPQGGLVFQFNY